MRDVTTFIRHGIHAAVLAALLCCGSGCGLGLLFGTPPSAANIQLRKQIQQLNGQIAALKQQTAGQETVIKGLRERDGVLQTLPSERINKLWTTHSLKFGKLTGGWDQKVDVPGDEGIKVYAAPLDEEGQPIKMAGSFTVELFDLADKSETAIGTWKFDTDVSRRLWRGSLMDYTYVLECPWQQQVPKHSELTVKVTFFDELTQTPFHAQQVITVNLPPATRPSTKPSSGG